MAGTKCKVVINRTYEKTQTRGMAGVYINDALVFACVTLERPDLKNQKKISCIPAGEYDVIKEYSNAFKRTLPEIKNVPNRSECKFHACNFVKELEGCIGLGLIHMDLNSDTVKDLAYSKTALEVFMKVTPNEFKLIIM